MLDMKNYMEIKVADKNCISETLMCGSETQQKVVYKTLICGSESSI